MISIIVPTINSAIYLNAFLDSLTSQTYKNFEIIVNDDLKTEDGTKGVVRKYSEKLKIKYMQKNYSIAQGRKSGSEYAKGEYQLHLDVDMVLSPKVLRGCLDEIKNCDAIIIPEISFGEGFWAKVRIFERSFYMGDDTVESARFFKTSVYNKVKGHNVDMVFSEDKDLDLRVRAAGFRLSRIKEPIYHNEGRLTLSKDLRKKFFYGKTAQVFVSTNPGHAFKQANLIFRPAFFRQWRRLLENPFLSISMFALKLLEIVAVLFGLISTKISFK